MSMDHLKSVEYLLIEYINFTSACGKQKRDDAIYNS